MCVCVLCMCVCAVCVCVRVCVCTCVYELTFRWVNHSTAHLLQAVYSDLLHNHLDSKFFTNYCYYLVTKQQYNAAAVDEKCSLGKYILL